MMKVGHLARFVHDGQLVLITFVPRIGVIDGIFVGGERNGKTVTSHSSLLEDLNESR